MIWIFWSFFFSRKWAYGMEEIEIGIFERWRKRGRKKGWVCWVWLCWGGERLRERMDGWMDGGFLITACVSKGKRGGEGSWGIRLVLAEMNPKLCHRGCFILPPHQHPTPIRKKNQISSFGPSKRTHVLYLCLLKKNRDPSMPIPQRLEPIYSTQQKSRELFLR